ncbi:protein argonaute-2 isoform X2 [Wyeomyia smithii]|uniref:protein argonaute-2 isoform X2 n=1 Tax=Wyeomyia smithii TaxID=174621 RepID=UPI002467B37C|nr:protein argonaute-2 isoform X2 [Wyeomyia smithii]
MDIQGKKKQKKNQPGTNPQAPSGSTPAPSPAPASSQQAGGKGKKKYQHAGGGDKPHEQKKQQKFQQGHQQGQQYQQQQQHHQGQQQYSRGQQQYSQSEQQYPQGQQQYVQGQQQYSQGQQRYPQGRQQYMQGQQQYLQAQQQYPQGQQQYPQGQQQYPQGQQQYLQGQQQHPQGQQQYPQGQQQYLQGQQQHPQGQQKYLQGQQQYPQGQQHLQTEQQISSSADAQPQKLPYKQRQQLKQQSEEQQRESTPSSSGSSAAQQPKSSYKQKQQMKHSEKPAESTPPTPTSTHSSSPSHAAALERVEEDFGGMKIGKQKLHSSSLMQVLERPNAYGKQGTRIRLEVNYIELLVEKLTGTAYHYDVDIKPPASRKWQRAAFQAFAREVFPGFNFAFDGNKNAYSAKRVESDFYENEVKVKEDGRERKFTVAMKEAAVLDMSSLKSYLKSNNYTKPMAAIQCLDVVLRTAYENDPKFVKFKKSIYVVPSQPQSVGENHELWYGLFQSALLGSKPFLNIDVSHKAFPSGGKILDILRDMNRSTPVSNEPLQPWLMNNITTYLKGMEISYTGPTGANRIFKFNKFKNAANKETFKTETGQVLTVEQYFRQQGYPLKYPNLPVMHVGSTVRNILLPIELCSVPRGQALNKKHPDSCTQQIIRSSATDTATRKRKIIDLFSQINYNNAPTIKEFGLSVGTKFEEVDGRVLEAPYLEYRGNKTIQPSRGVWRAEKYQFLLPSTDIVRRSLCWTILNLDQRTRQDAIERFGKMIYDISKRQDVQLEPFSMARNWMEPRVMREYIRELDSIFGKLKADRMDLVIVIIPGIGDAYAKVKQKAELVTGLLTQCIKGDTIFKKGTDQSTLNNIWLKINAKTNGTNHKLVQNYKPPFARKHVMFVGADVTHPSPEQTNIPSVVGVAASYDLEGFRYNCCYRLQNPKDEMIRDLENIVCKQLRLYQQQNNSLPELIMYYRDGVSEGQFAEILTIELRAIQDAIAKINPEYKPNVTFIVVQKRHHARFFPTGGFLTEGKNNNVQPGTIVDRHITAPNQYQFFLVSHAAVQGVAKPTKYCVLYDDEKCDPDQLQALTYNLCHMFARCNRSVSYPAPTYYAHLAAYRGRVYIKDRPLNMDNLLHEYQQLQIKTEIIDGHPMFFV